MWLYFMHFVADVCVCVCVCVVFVSTGVHTLQQMYGCELDDNGFIRGFWLYGYDGEDYISMNLTTETWTAANDKAVITKQRLESEDWAPQVKDYLETECTDWLLKYVEYGRSTLERKGTVI